MGLQRRYLWSILAAETVGFLALAGWVLTRLDRLFEAQSLLVALAIVVAGDLVTVLLMQRFAPTRITFAAGEMEGLRGEAVSGFGERLRGRVVVRGEQWAADVTGSDRIEPGDPVRVVSRGGLTLRVERWS